MDAIKQIQQQKREEYKAALQKINNEIKSNFTPEEARAYYVKAIIRLAEEHVPDHARNELYFLHLKFRSHNLESVET